MTAPVKKSVTTGTASPVVVGKTVSELLREPFPPALVGKLPRVTCADCRAARDKHCAKHARRKCSACGSYITEAHIHLDYVGHAAVTDRLLQVDSAWTWEFAAANADGSPVVVRDGFADPDAKVGLWIRLTVAAMTRPGFGEGKNYKEAIGDALRNAAMRFGVGLDLWAKEDLNRDIGAPPSPNSPAPEAESPQIAADEPLASAAEQKKLDRLIVNLTKIDGTKDWGSITDRYIRREFECGRDQLTSERLLLAVRELSNHLDALDKARLAQKAAS